MALCPAIQRYTTPYDGPKRCSRSFSFLWAHIYNIGTLADSSSANTKIIYISGAIETINMSMMNICQYLPEQFFVAVGEGGTLHNLYPDYGTEITAKYALLAQAIAMNAKKNGSLVAVSIKDLDIHGRAKQGDNQLRDPAKSLSTEVT